MKPQMFCYIEMSEVSQHCSILSFSCGKSNFCGDLSKDKKKAVSRIFHGMFHSEYQDKISVFSFEISV